MSQTNAPAPVINKLAGKTVTLQLVGLDSNAFALLGAFQRQARREGWTEEEIAVVLDDAQSGDYNHLLQVLLAYTTPPESFFDEETDWGEPDDGSEAE